MISRAYCIRTGLRSVPVFSDGLRFPWPAPPETVFPALSPPIVLFFAGRGMIRVQNEEAKLSAFGVDRISMTTCSKVAGCRKGDGLVSLEKFLRRACQDAR